MVLGESGGGERQQRQGSVPAAGNQTLSCQAIGNWFSKLCRHTQSLLYLLCLPFQLQLGLRLDPSSGRCPGRNLSHKSLFQLIFPGWQGAEGWYLVGLLAPGLSLSCLHPTLGLLHLGHWKVAALPEAPMSPLTPSRSVICPLLWRLADKLLSLH